MKTLPLIGIIIGILILRPLKGGGLLVYINVGNHLGPYNRKSNLVATPADQSIPEFPKNGVPIINGSFPKIRAPWWGPYNKDYNILG